MSDHFASLEGAGEAATSERYQKRRAAFEKQIGKVELTPLDQALESAEIEEWKVIFKWCLKRVKDSNVDEKYGFVFAYTFDHEIPSMSDKNPYRVLNNALITGGALSVFKTSSFLFGLLHALRSLPYTKFTHLYRGIPEKTEWEAEEVKVWSAFTSMSLDIEVGKKFLGGTETTRSGTLFRGRGLCGYYIADFSIMDEKEVLLEPFQSILSEGVEECGELVCVDIVDGGMTKLIAIEQIPQTNHPTIEVSDQLFNALSLHREGKHKEAVGIYLREADEGNKIACLNVGNCYLFGVGVECDVMKGLSWWMNGGHVEDENIGLYKLLSNFQYMGRSDIDLSGLFLL